MHIGPRQVQHPATVNLYPGINSILEREHLAGGYSTVEIHS